MLFQQVPHYHVVAVGVNPDVVAVCQAEGKHGGECPSGMVAGGYTVDDMIGMGIVCPFAFIDAGVSGLRRRDEGERTDNLARFFYHIAHPTANIVQEDIGGRITIGPLVHIAAFPHLPAGIFGK